MVLHPYQVDLIEQWTDPFIKAHTTCIAVGGAETTTLAAYFVEKTKPRLRKERLSRERDSEPSSGPGERRRLEPIGPYIDVLATGHVLP